MSEILVELDPLNPGQFYACCGLSELISASAPDVVSQFEAERGRPRVAKFIVQGSFPANTLCDTLQQLKASAVTLEDIPDQANRPVILTDSSGTRTFDWWLTVFRDKKSPIKCWAGQVTTRKLFEELLPLLDQSSDGSNIFQKNELTKSKFGVDPRSAWNARDHGFSPNEHGKDTSTFVAVELLAAIGLQSFRPEPRRRVCSYHLWKAPLPLCLARTASTTPWDGLPRQSVQFSIGSRGQSYKYFKFGQSILETKEKV